jgi:hypothetical protein
MLHTILICYIPIKNAIPSEFVSQGKQIPDDSGTPLRSAKVQKYARTQVHKNVKTSFRQFNIKKGKIRKIRELFG